jgi:hypothetical protein
MRQRAKAVRHPGPGPPISSLPSVDRHDCEYWIGAEDIVAHGRERWHGKSRSGATATVVLDTITPAPSPSPTQGGHWRSVRVTRFQRRRGALFGTHSSGARLRSTLFRCFRMKGRDLLDNPEAAAFRATHPLCIPLTQRHDDSESLVALAAQVLIGRHAETLRPGDRAIRSMIRGGASPALRETAGRASGMPLPCGSGEPELAPLYCRNNAFTAPQVGDSTGVPCSK